MGNNTRVTKPSDVTNRVRNSEIKDKINEFENFNYIL